MYVDAAEKELRASGGKRYGTIKIKRDAEVKRRPVLYCSIAQHKKRVRFELFHRTAPVEYENQFRQIFSHRRILLAYRALLLYERRIQRDGNQKVAR
jgi:hypothetical protein